MKPFVMKFLVDTAQNPVLGVGNLLEADSCLSADLYSLMADYTVAVWHPVQAAQQDPLGNGDQHTFVPLVPGLSGRLSNNVRRQVCHSNAAHGSAAVADCSTAHAAAAACAVSVALHSTLARTLTWPLCAASATCGRVAALAARPPGLSPDGAVTAGICTGG